MATFSETTYERPTVEKVNPFVEHVQQFTSKGVDTAFAVEFTAGEYKAEKLQIQKAVNFHGFSAREVESTWEDGLDADTPVKSTFIIRPARKAKAAEDVAPE